MSEERGDLGRVSGVVGGLARGQPQKEKRFCFNRVAIGMDWRSVLNGNSGGA